jgi:hypothetical protein
VVKKEIFCSCVLHREERHTIKQTLDTHLLTFGGGKFGMVKSGGRNINKTKEHEMGRRFDEHIIFFALKKLLDTLKVFTFFFLTASYEKERID